MMMVPKTPIPPRENHERVLASIALGLRFVFSNQIIWGALSLDLFAVLFGGAVALLPFFTAEILQGPAWQLGVLRAAPAVGAVLMGLHLAHQPLPGKAGKRLLFAVAGFGVTIVAFAISRNFYVSLAILALGGAFDSVSVVVRSTLIQLHTPDEMRGRVASVNNIFIGSSNEIGEFESGVMARLLGVVPSVVFGGMMTLIVVGAMSFLAPKLRDLDKLSDAK
jgi:MFS family permease